MAEDPQACRRRSIPLTLKRKLAYVATILAFSVALMEVAVRAIVVATRGPLLYETDAQLGYKLRANLHVTRQVHGQTWSFSTDSDGRRVVLDHPRPKDAPTVVIVGDSFAFGQGVSDEETFAAHISRDGFSVVNLGVHGYGTNQELLALRRFHKNESADYVIVLVYTNDLDDVLCSFKHMRHRPTASLVRGKLHLDNFHPPITDYLIDYSYLCALIRYCFQHTERIRGDGPAVVAACLSAIKKEALRMKSTPIFVFQDAKRPESLRQLLAACQQLNLPVVDLSPTLNEHIQDIIGPDGIHWNALGHRIVADAILTILK